VIWGLVVGWIPRHIKVINLWSINYHLGVEVFSANPDLALTLINMYEQTQNRKEFSENILNISIFISNSTIIGKDLNFSLGP